MSRGFGGSAESDGYSAPMGFWARSWCWGGEAELSAGMGAAFARSAHLGTPETMGWKSYLPAGKVTTDGISYQNLLMK